MGTIGGLLMSIDDMYKKEEKKLRKLFDTKLLSELLLLNYLKIYIIVRQIIAKKYILIIYSLI